MCLQLTKLEDSNGPIRTSATLTYRELVATGLRFGGQISVAQDGAGNHQQPGTVCKCNADSDEYCGISHNSYWTFDVQKSDYHAEMSFFDRGEVGIYVVFCMVGSPSCLYRSQRLGSSLT